MTNVDEHTFEPEDIRLLVREARDVVDQLRRLPGAAESLESQHWAQNRADAASHQWAQLVSTLLSQTADYLPGALKAIFMNGVPLAEAPRELRPAADQARASANQLSRDFRRVILPMIGPDALMRPEVDTALTPIIREIGAEFD